MLPEVIDLLDAAEWAWLCNPRYCQRAHLARCAGVGNLHQRREPRAQERLTGHFCGAVVPASYRLEDPFATEVRVLIANTNLLVRRQ